MSQSVKNIYLASNSPRRKAIFDFIGLSYKKIEIQCEEKTSETDPSKVCEDITKQKLKAARQSIKKDDASDIGESDLVIVSDTIVCLGDKVYGKPKNKIEAKKILSELSGRSHLVMTGVGCAIGDKDFYFSDTTTVFFRDLTEKMIDYYLEKNTFGDKAGAYAIQSEDCFFAEKIDGSYSNVIGFPIEKFREFLKCEC